MFRLYYLYCKLLKYLNLNQYNTLFFFHRQTLYITSLKQKLFPNYFFEYDGLKNNSE